MNICYIIKGQKDFYYCGITKRISNRIKQHNNKQNKSTCRNTPYKIIYSRIFSTIKEAAIQEKKVKRQGVRKWYFKNVFFKKLF